MLHKILIFSIVVLLGTGTLFAQQGLREQWKSIDSVISCRWQEEIAHSKNLPYPFVSAFKGADFIFYWDTYFINKGLIAQHMDSLAMFNVQNILSVVDRYGFMGNAAVTAWGMNRSQPPFLSQMVWDVYVAGKEKNQQFLAYAYPILIKEYSFWTNSGETNIEDHHTAIAGLQRYGTHASREELLRLYEELESRFNLPAGLDDDHKVKTAYPYAVEAATGMDFTPRFEHRCPEFIALDLNSLLYNMETNMGLIATRLHLSEATTWNQRAERRKALINRYCWNEKRGFYLDYDFVHHRSSRCASSIGFIPLWAGIASAKQAKKVRRNLRLFQSTSGLTAVDRSSDEVHYQWGPTAIWAPLQLLAVDGLLRYGFKKEAEGLRADYLNLIANNYLNPVPGEYREGRKDVHREKGYLYEKYKIDGTIDDDEYTANRMMGWTAGVFAAFYHLVIR